MMGRLSAPDAADTSSKKSAIRIGSTFREFPDFESVLSEDQFAIRVSIEIERLLNKLEFFVHRQFPTRLRVAGSPDELLTSELFVGGLEKRERVAIGKICRERDFILL